MAGLEEADSCESCDFFDELPVREGIRDLGEVSLQILLFGFAPLLLLGNIAAGLSPEAPDIVTTSSKPWQGSSRAEDVEIRHSTWSQCHWNLTQCVKG